MATRHGGKGMSGKSGTSISGSYGSRGEVSQYNLENDDDGSGDKGSRDDSCNIKPEKSQQELRREHNTETYDKMRDRDEILRDLYADYAHGRVIADNLILQVLLDIRDILRETKTNQPLRRTSR